MLVRRNRQAIASTMTSSPIGVAPEPPVIHCNVTVSEGGGGGVANDNGNVWSANTARNIDSCITQQ